MSLLIALFSLPFSESIKNIFIVGAYIFGITILIKKRAIPRISPVGWALLLFVLISVLSAINSSYPHKAMHGVWDILGPTVLYIILINITDSHKRIRTILSIVVLSIGLGSILGISEYLLSTKSIVKLQIHSLGNTPGYLVIMIGLMIGLLVNMKLRTLERAVLILITLLSGIALILANSRMSWGSLVVIFVTFSLLKRTKAMFKTMLLSLLLFVILIVSFVMINHDIPLTRIKTLANPITDAAFISRIPIWKGSLAMALDHPILGVGPKCFQTDWDWELDEKRQKYGIPWEHGQAHNMFLNVAAEMGIMGVIALVIWLACYIYFLFRSKKVIKDELTLSLWYGALGGWIALIVGGMMDSYIGSEVSILIMLILALLYSGCQLDKKQNA